MTRRFVCVLVAVLAAWPLQPPIAMSQEAPAAATLPASASSPAPVPAAPPFAPMHRLPLAEAMKVPIPGDEFSLDELAKQWPFFHHRPFDDAGFNAVSLPFRYDAKTDPADPNEAYAFSFLLSNALDWAPGCYCARHAYFVFKRSRDDMDALREAYLNYDPFVLRRVVKDWNATHAVGGALTKQAGGYCGVLEIYDPNGTAVLTTEYKEPRDFCVLVGDMAADAMRFFGDKPSAPLVAHLRRKRCQDASLLAELGTAAFAEERSPEEFAIYDHILSCEPNFAEVRYWWANQRRWHDNNIKRYVEQEALALQECPILSALFDFNPRAHPDPNGAAKVFDQALAGARKFMGEDAPLILRLQLEHGPKDISGSQLAHATAVAGQYPNDYWLLVRIGNEYMNRNDLAMAASVYIAAVRCSYLTGTGSRRDALAGLAYCLGVMAKGVSLRFSMMALQEDLDNNNEGNLAWDYGWVGADYGDMGWYDEAIEPLRQEFRGAPFSGRERLFAALYGGINAAYAGRIAVCDQILRDRRAVLDADGQAFVLEAYRQAAVDPNNPPRADDVEKKSTTTKYYEILREHILYAELDLMAGQDKRRAQLTQTLAECVHCRPVWILFDLYDRHQTRADSASFYEALEWLHDDDPWARQAVADFHRRCPAPQIPSAEDILARLKDYPPVQWPTTQPDCQKAALAVADRIPPGAVEAAIHALIQKHDFDKALELALRFHRLAMDTDYHYFISQGNWLIHLVEEAKRDAALPAGPPTPATKPAAGRNSTDYRAGMAS